MNEEYIFNPDDTLEDALAMLAAGVPLEDVLAQAGSDAGWLRPMLETATEVEALRPDIPLPPPDASLQRLLDYGAELAAPAPPAVPAPRPARQIITLPTLLTGGRQLALSGSVIFMLTLGLLAVFLAGGVVGGGLILAAQDSLPGQPLYQVKQFGESLRLNLAQTPGQREQLLERFNRHRLEEIQRLLEQGYNAQVSFAGTADSVMPNELKAEGLTIQITSETKINGQLANGAGVRVEGTTRPPNGLLATSITVVEPAPPPTPTTTPTPTATAVPPTATQKPVLEATSDTIVLPPTRTPTATPSPTATPVPPTPTATGDTSGNDSSSDAPPPIPTAEPSEDANSNTGDNLDDDIEPDDETEFEEETGDNDNSSPDNSDFISGDGDDDNSGSNNNGDDSDDSDDDDDDSDDDDK